MSAPDRAKRAQQPWCPHCKAPAGPDCPDVSADRRTARNRPRFQDLLRRRSELLAQRDAIKEH